MYIYMYIYKYLYYQWQELLCLILKGDVPCDLSASK